MEFRIGKQGCIQLFRLQLVCTDPNQSGTGENWTLNFGIRMDQPRWHFERFLALARPLSSLADMRERRCRRL